jgi:hypothetical protein
MLLVLAAKVESCRDNTIKLLHKCLDEQGVGNTIKLLHKCFVLLSPLLMPFGWVYVFYVGQIDKIMKPFSILHS